MMAMDVNLAMIFLRKKNKFEISVLTNCAIWTFCEVTIRSLANVHGISTVLFSRNAILYMYRIM